MTIHCTPPELALAVAHRTLARPEASDRELLVACSAILGSELAGEEAKHRAANLRHLIEGETGV